MPGIRKQGKHLVGGYVDGELADKFKELCDASGITVTDKIIEFVRSEISRPANRDIINKNHKEEPTNE